MNIKNILNDNKLSLLNAFVVTLIFYILEEALFNHPQISYVTQIFNAQQLGQEGILALLSTLLMFVATVIFFYGFFVSPYWLMPIYAFLFIGITVGEYGYQKALQRFAVAWDVEIGITSPAEVWEDGIKLFFDWKTLIPFTILAAFLLITKTKRNWKTGLLSLMLAFGIAWMQLGFKPIPSYGLNWGGTLLQGINAGVNYIKLRTTFAQREKVTYHAQTLPTNNIVLIIDESLRGDHLSVNGYSRETTPHLEALSKNTDLFHNWGLAISGATCSNSSNGLLITGSPIEQDGLAFIQSYPTLFQYAKAMGYKTTYIDVQTNLFWNGLNSSDLQYLDNRITNDDLNEGKNSPDFNAAEAINSMISNSSGNFIVINKLGVHFIYEDVYPKSATVWSPVPQSQAEFEDPELTVNSYDNALLYNINGFFEELLPEANQLNVYTENTFFIYTSDHAETLYQNGATSSHCSGTKPETEVPLIIFGKLPVSVDTDYKASHSNIFATILDLMNVPTQARLHQYNLSLLEAKASDSKNRPFFNSDGSILIYENLP